MPPIFIDGSHVNHIYNGTPGDDVFVSTLPNLDGAIINGMAGHDTLKVTGSVSFQSTFTANDVEDIQFDGNPSVARLTVNGSGVNSLAFSSAYSQFWWTGPNPHILNFNADAGNVRVDATDTGGTAGHITVNTNGHSGPLFVYGIEQVDMVMGDHSDASVILGQLSPGATAGTVNLTGSASDFSLTFRILSVSSPNLTDGVVNASLATGNQTILQNFAADYNLTITITSGSGNDTLSALGDHARLPIAGSNAGLLFSIADGTHYFMNSGDGVTPAAVIKIVLANGLDWNNMVADTNGAHYVPPPIQILFLIQAFARSTSSICNRPASPRCKGRRVY